MNSDSRPFPVGEDLEIEVVGLEEPNPSSPSPPVEHGGGPTPSQLRQEGRLEGIRQVLRQLLPALDALESCFRETSDQETLEQGVRLALRGIWDVFRPHELERIEGDRVPFDPSVHEGVEVTPSAAVPPGTVLQVLRVGYRLGGDLVRPAMVRVSAPPATAPEQDGSERR